MHVLHLQYSSWEHVPALHKATSRTHSLACVVFCGLCPAAATHAICEPRSDRLRNMVDLVLGSICPARFHQGSARPTLLGCVASIVVWLLTDDAAPARGRALTSMRGLKRFEAGS
jgi:hypothetical protein